MNISSGEDLLESATRYKISDIVSEFHKLPSSQKDKFDNILTSSFEILNDEYRARVSERPRNRLGKPIVPTYIAARLKKVREKLNAIRSATVLGHASEDEVVRLRYRIFSIIKRMAIPLSRSHTTRIRGWHESSSGLSVEAYPNYRPYEYVSVTYIFGGYSVREPSPERVAIVVNTILSLAEAVSNIPARVIVDADRMGFKVFPV